MFPELMYNWVTSRDKKVIDHISPSMLGGCPRVHYYAIKHIEPTTPPNPGALLNFQVGFLWEQVLEKALEGQEFESQKELYDKELNVKGTLDFLIKTDVGWEVIDCKTESLLASQYRKRAGSDYLSEHKRYVIQVGTYILLLRRQGIDVKQGRIVNIIKDNGLVQEYIVDYTPELEKEILARIDYLNQCIKNNQLPRCECQGWEVGYCNYGNPETQQPNKSKKIVNTECCPDLETLEKWRKK